MIFLTDGQTLNNKKSNQGSYKEPNPTRYLQNQIKLELKMIPITQIAICKCCGNTIILFKTMTLNNAPDDLLRIFTDSIPRE